MTSLRATCIREIANEETWRAHRQGGWLAGVQRDAVSDCCPQPRADHGEEQACGGCLAVRGFGSLQDLPRRYLQARLRNHPALQDHVEGWARLRILSRPGRRSRG